MTSPKRLAVAGGGAPPAYIEDVFSTYLYTGNGSTQTITNGIDLSGKGGLVWIKGRSGATGHRLTDTARGATKSLESNSTAVEATESTGLTAFNGTGFSIGADADYNTNTATYVSWTFREQAKFFDIVTYTGNGSNRTIAHNLGSVPGCIIVKRTDTTADWQVYHRSLANTEYLVLNTTAAKATGTTRWNSTTPTSTEFSLGTDTTVNASGGTYVAYLFAHDAGGFGLTGTDNVISCGSFTTDGSGNATVTLGYEPQWVLVKQATGNPLGWLIFDSMRGFVHGAAANTSDDVRLAANSSGAEGTQNFGRPTATGFDVGYGDPSQTHIYIAIRRGPMKVPTSGTSVYENVAYAGNQATQRQIGTNVLLDMMLLSDRNATSTNWATYAHYIFDRMRGENVSLATSFADSQSGGWDTYIDFDKNAGWDTSSLAGQDYFNNTGNNYVSHIFRRAPGFFDVVAYRGTGANRTVNHNLAAVPEMMIVKRRDSAADWWVYDAATGNTKYQVLNSTATPVTSATAWNNTTPTSTVFTVGTGTPVNSSAGTYIAYLFATAPGVSKVGSYTGNGTSQTINCGFTTGARFILIKRTSGAGDWYVWDTARGIVAANDPRVSLNTIAAEVTTDDSVDPDSTGFIVNQVAATNINVNAATYIFLAIA